MNTKSREEEHKVMVIAVACVLLFQNLFEEDFETETCTSFDVSIYT